MDLNLGLREMEFRRHQQTWVMEALGGGGHGGDGCRSAAEEELGRLTERGKPRCHLHVP